jgi:hypothetical protein
MRRLAIISTAALVLLAVVPAGAMARHRHRRHHSRTHHVSFKRFGSDATGAPPSSSSTDNAGTVMSFSNGVLTISLNDGPTVSGAVTSDTELECTASEESQTMGEDGDGGGGDQSGDGENSASEDDQAQENENAAENSCSAANLTPGAVVHEAELRITSAGSVWSKVELVS